MERIEVHFPGGYKVVILLSTNATAREPVAPSACSQLRSRARLGIRTLTPSTHSSAFLSNDLPCTIMAWGKLPPTSCLPARLRLVETAWVIRIESHTPSDSFRSVRPSRALA